jgi:pyruvate formate lyase activating enzyme
MEGRGSETGVVFDVQPFSVHDGPGIRTTVFLKGCPLRCAWCCNPESQSPFPELRHRVSRCRRCLACVEACAHGGASEREGAPAFDRGRCAACPGHECAAACPEGALVVSGKEMTVADLVEAALADEAFFRNSGGGVSFSGGEPFAQPRFLKEALLRLRAAGVRTAVETCGCVEPETVEGIVPLLDLVFFDLKIADPEEHRRLTGRTNGPILAALARLARAAPEKVVLRFPLIPGITDGGENVREVARAAASLGLARVSVVPYHPMGTPKYAELGRTAPAAPPPVTRAGLERVFAAFEAAGLACELA